MSLATYALAGVGAGAQLPCVKARLPRSVLLFVDRSGRYGHATAQGGGHVTAVVSAVDAGAHPTSPTIPARPIVSGSGSLGARRMQLQIGCISEPSHELLVDDDRV